MGHSNNAAVRCRFGKGDSRHIYCRRIGEKEIDFIAFVVFVPPSK
jgi:hypothetical protein